MRRKAYGEPVGRLLPADPPAHGNGTFRRDLLIGAARDRARMGELLQAGILRAAQHVATVVPDVQPELGWRMTRDACVNIATAGIAVITTLRDGAGTEQCAVAAAQAAMIAVAEVPEQC